MNADLHVLVTATSFLDDLETHPKGEHDGRDILGALAADTERRISLTYRCDRDPAIPMSPEELSGVTHVIADLERYDAALFASCDTLQLISRYGVGYDSIDVAAAQSAGVAVANTPGANTLPTAEWALATILCTAGRRIPHQNNGAAGRKKSGPSRIDVSGRTLGVIGTGRIGRELVRLMRPFDPRVLVCDPLVDLEWGTSVGAEYVTLDELCRQSDLISIHAASPKEVVGAREIRLMKRTAVLVNCARRHLVDSRAAYTAVVRGDLFGFGLDESWDHEDLPLGELNITVSPHVGSDTDNGKVEMRRESARAVREHILTGRVSNAVVFER